MTELIGSGTAKRDLFRIAFDGYAYDPEDLLAKMAAAHALLEQPGMGSPTRRRNIRKWPIPKSPFILLYAVGKNRLEIPRVMHAASASASAF
jgi:plasmid stabilization system protein ParE